MGWVICPRCHGLGRIADVPVYDEDGNITHTIDKPCNCENGHIWKPDPSERSYDEF